jgi:hypothetical protein
VDDADLMHKVKPGYDVTDLRFIFQSKLRGDPEARTHVRQPISLWMALEKLTDGSLGHPLADQAYAGAEHVPDAKERNYVIVPEVLPCDGLTPKGLPYPLGSGPLDQCESFIPS